MISRSCGRHDWRNSGGRDDLSSKDRNRVFVENSCLLIFDEHQLSEQHLNRIAVADDDEPVRTGQKVKAPAPYLGNEKIAPDLPVHPGDGAADNAGSVPPGRAHKADPFLRRGVHRGRACGKRGRMKMGHVQSFHALGQQAVILTPLAPRASGRPPPPSHPLPAAWRNSAPHEPYGPRPSRSPG